MVDAGIAVVSVAAKLTLAPHWPTVLLTVIFGGQLITGGTPVTVTVNEQVAVNPPASVTTCATVVTPIGNVDPLARPAVLAVMAPEQLSVPTGAV